VRNEGLDEKMIRLKMALTPGGGSQDVDRLGAHRCPHSLPPLSALSFMTGYGSCSARQSGIPSKILVSVRVPLLPVVAVKISRSTERVRSV
jgi:hypothetical protein